MAVIDCSAPLGNPSLIEAWTLLETKLKGKGEAMSGSKSQVKPVEESVSKSKPIETPIPTVQPKAVPVDQDQLMKTIRQQQHQMQQMEQMLRDQQQPAGVTVNPPQVEDDDDDRQVIIIQSQPTASDDASWVPWVAGAAIGAAAVGAGVLIYNMFND